MSAPVLVAPGEGEVIGDSPERRVEILSDVEPLNATWSRFAAGREGADLHVHREHSDLFYVLEGELTVRLGPEGEPARVPAGSLARVPPNVVHGFRNASDREMRYLNFHAPGRRFADYLRSLRDGRSLTYDQHPPPADGGRPATSASIATGEVFERAGGRLMLLADVEEIGVAEVRVDPDGRLADAHRHREHTESLYVLEGELTVATAAGELRAGPGAWLQLPAGVAHAVAPAGGSPVRFLELHTPSRGFGSFVRSPEAAFDQSPATY